MKSYGKVRSTVKPEPFVMDKFSAWESNNIKEVSENIGAENEFIGFEFELAQYDKDEYVKKLFEQNTFLEEQISNTQIALTEIYESKGGLPWKKSIMNLSKKD